MNLANLRRRDSSASGAVVLDDAERVLACTTNALLAPDIVALGVAG